ncbi:hypothetical protein CY34DRAFT_109093 [Suillus luteus UH-Slu-Lm8-n1]|uniref:Uncharacterized protein n=1 Tax=Suillus luteus UH-Slu-Lm8-n1 TaxID=930992 RepID=A0A0D0AH38_9AGAM|nr:hypothetical protein CY34DRAFT_109093 [Suillus luteus UH-Slu-Lm8-n1]
MQTCHSVGGVSSKCVVHIGPKPRTLHVRALHQQQEDARKLCASLLKSMFLSSLPPPGEKSFTVSHIGDEVTLYQELEQITMAQLRYKANFEHPPLSDDVSEDFLIEVVDIFGSSPIRPTTTITICTLNVYWQSHRVCPQLSIQAQVKMLCALHNMKFNQLVVVKGGDGLLPLTLMICGLMSLTQMTLQSHPVSSGILVTVCQHGFLLVRSGELSIPKLISDPANKFLVTDEQMARAEVEGRLLITPANEISIDTLTTALLDFSVQAHSLTPMHINIIRAIANLLFKTDHDKKLRHIASSVTSMLEEPLNRLEELARIKSSEADTGKNTDLLTNLKNSVECISPSIKNLQDNLTSAATIDTRLDKIQSNYCNGGTVIEMTSEAAAAYVKQQEIKNEFIKAIDPTAIMKDHAYPVIIQFVPLTFNPSNQNQICDLEQENKLETGMITAAKWVKSPTKRTLTQQVAHLLVTFKNPNVINRDQRWHHDQSYQATTQEEQT